ncbi:MAG: HlyD family efflux transporter periplasmic adaptor subunit [Candidatus Omnitrophica bacterium]|nr:HlyD family efflux transporter periplasmic adaptor subunit [Candidatus Omnitrophota bacterium]
MHTKKITLLFIVLIISGTIAGYLLKTKKNESAQQATGEISPFFGSIRNVISSTGTVLPKNRLEIKPPVNGRIERILVKEGDTIKTGQILAWMSSTERAALLDAARGKGEETLKYWQETYKPIPLPAPIDGEVIVATTQPGQTVTASDAVVVLSDRLIVRAQVDETDIGKITPAMKAIITIDAYPDIKINASVEHIYYESETVNNVTIYKVDLLPEETPLFFRSGMNANIDFIEVNKDNVLLIPLEAVEQDKGGNYVLVRQGNNKEPSRALVKLGISDDKNAEVVSGITAGDRIILKTKKYTLPQAASTGSNPFLPSRRR